MTVRPDGEALARELTLGALSYGDLARRIRMVAERLFTRRIPLLTLVIADPEHNDLFQVIRTGVSSSEEETGRLGTATLEAFAARLDEPLLLGPDLAAECRTRGVEPPSTPYSSLLLIPLVREAKRQGAVILGLDLPPGVEITRRWSALVGATKVIVAALHSCREHERTLADRLDLEKIAQAGARLQILASLADTCALATRVLVDEFDFDRSILLLTDEEHKRLEGVAGVGYEDICPLLRIPLSHDSDVLVRVLSSGEPWMTRQAADDPMVPVVLRESGEIHDAVALPLRTGGHSIGVLWADHRAAGGRLSPHRVALLSMYAAQAAAAIYNSRLLRRIELLAETDALTGVANRRYLETILRREIARVRRHGSPLSLMMVDIDQFKALNDQYGHEYGDTILREIAAMIRRTMRETDFVARFGGDEFVVLMPDTTEEQAACAQQRLANALTLYNQHKNPDAPRISLSLGLRAANSETVESILDEADRRMYAAKEETIRSRLLEALITNRHEDILLWDHFVANSLKVLSDKEPHYTDHSRRVMQMALQIAGRLALSEHERVILGLAALLHDVGKISIPSGLLNRPGPLTDEELAIVRAHCVLGDELLRGAAYLAPVRSIVHAHHERYDAQTQGRYGAYPDATKGEDIPLGARILKIADSYDAITSGRCYQPSRPSAAALSILREEKAKAFDPNLVDILLDYLQPHLMSPAPPHPPPAN